MAFYTQADKVAIQSMQTDDKQMKEIEKAKKNKSKRSMGRPLSQDELAKLKPIALEFDTAALEQELKDNNKYLKEVGLSELTWEELYGEKFTEKPTNKNAFEHYIEIEVQDTGCRVCISDNGFNKGQEWATKLGKPTQKLKTGELFWSLPCNYFVFGGKRYSVSKVSGAAQHGSVHILWSSMNPKIVLYEAEDSRWIEHGRKMKQKHGCKARAVRKTNNITSYVAMVCPENLMKIPNKK